MANAVSEFNILVPTAIWLVDKGCSELKVSIAHGQGIPLNEQKARFKEILAEKGFTNISFAPHGPDLIARDEVRIWKVECKGLSRGAYSTVDNNFDRALASVVSYYDEPAAEAQSDVINAMNMLSYIDKPIRLALALPESDQYRRLLRERVKPALRRKLDLWILIVDPLTKSVECYDPDREVYRPNSL
jgi:hypothetical protein